MQDFKTSLLQNPFMDAREPQKNPAPAPAQSIPQNSNVEELQAALCALTADTQLQVLQKLPALQLARALERILKPGTAKETPMPDLPADIPEERRAFLRSKTLRAAQIIYNNKMSVTSCRIYDIASAGCQITVESTFSIPKFFTLHIKNGDTKHECEVVWRRPGEMGVRFI